MDTLVTLYHGGSVEEDVYGNVSFYGMKKVIVMFDERPSFGQIFARACEEISCNLNDPRISIQSLLSHVTSEIVVRHLISIASEDDWVKYVRIVKMIVPPCLDVVVRNLSFSHSAAPVGLSPQMPNASRSEAPLTELPEEVVVVPDAQSAPNEFKISRPVRGVCGASNPVVPPQEIPLTHDPIQDHPSKCI
jgi:hypothetical protein